MRRNRSPLLMMLAMALVAVNLVTLAIFQFLRPGVNGLPAPVLLVARASDVEEPLPPLPPGLTIEVLATKPEVWPDGQPVVVLGDRRLLHGHEVDAIAFRPDGGSLISVSREMVIAWDAATGKELARREPEASEFYKYSLVAARVGRVVEIEPSARPLKVTVFDWDTRKRLWADKLRPTPEGERHATVLSPDGKYLAVLVGNAVSLWDLDRKTESRVLTAGDRDCTAAVFTPDSKSLVVGDAGHTVRVWDLSGADAARIFSAAAGTEVAGLAVSPDGTKAASVGRQVNGRNFGDGLAEHTVFDIEVRLWDLEGGRLIGSVPAYPKGWADTGAKPSHTKLLFLDNGTLLTASGSISPNFVHRWDVATATQLPDFPSPLDRLFAFAVSPDGKVLAGATETGRICLFDMATGMEQAPVEAHNARIDSVAFSADGKTVLTGAGDGARAWDAVTGRPMARYRLDDPRLGEVTISKDGRVIVTQSHARSRTAVWDVAMGGLIRDFGMMIGSPIISADGSVIVASLFDGDRHGVGVWDARTGDQKWTTKQPADFRDESLFYGPVLSSNGRRLFVGRGQLAVFEIATGREIAHWDPKETGALPDGELLHFANVSVASTPDGKELAFGSEYSEEAVIVDALTGKPRLRIPTRSAAPLVFSADGRILATGGGWQDKSVRLWDFRTGAMIRELTGKPTRASMLAFSPDGKRVAAGCVDGTAILWDLSAK
ncbi:MAG TPA: PQQ-binding-like beta-propeller repeat protein [Gemmataceae bacterium]|nr:PQQ-binding-like beta-propeller repeat protein [Gemmataceae bacterium]